WNWLAATWIFLVISISTIISFQCLKKGKDAKAPAFAATQPPAPESIGAQPKSTASKPQADAGTPATPKPPAEAPAKPPAEAEAADGNYEDVAVGASPPPPPA
uniref:Uncharacterized protein n=1 Tax=Panagrolaimus sp. PS1159 TaxID=55785 RepID=A0AC35GEH6_9BILA